MSSRWTAETGIPLLFLLFVRGNDGIRCNRLMPEATAPVPPIPPPPPPPLLALHGAVGVVRFSVLALAAHEQYESSERKKVSHTKWMHLKRISNEFISTTISIASPPTKKHNIEYEIVNDT